MSFLTELDELTIYDEHKDLILVTFWSDQTVTVAANHVILDMKQIKELADRLNAFLKEANDAN